MDNKLKVVCPVEGKDQKTHWYRVGAAFKNADDSINVYLSTLPMNGKLQLRKWDEESRYPRDGAPTSGGGSAEAPPF